MLNKPGLLGTFLLPCGRVICWLSSGAWRDSVATGCQSHPSIPDGTCHLQVCLQSYKTFCQGREPWCGLQQHGEVSWSGAYFRFLEQVQPLSPHGASSLGGCHCSLINITQHPCQKKQGQAEALRKIRGQLQGDLREDLALPL